MNKGAGERGEKKKEEEEKDDDLSFISNVLKFTYLFSSLF